jgi:type IV pilus assembly protein PilA
MLYRIRNRAQEQGGFTLIELLVVILIIGILAAIAIPTFLNQRGKAQDASAKSELRNAATAEETYYTDSQTYTATPANLTAIEPSLTQGFAATTATPPGDGMTIVAADTGANKYHLQVVSKSNVTYDYIDNNGTVTRSCSVPTGTNAAGCANLGAAAGGVQIGSW